VPTGKILVIAKVALSREVDFQLALRFATGHALPLASAIALMFIVGVFASYILARHAMRVDPMVALTYE
jgi:hypothetical protein